MSAQNLPTIAWTGERMVPHASDAATELYHWQRYLFFQPWYVGAKVIDAASGEGYGTNYAAIYAESASGIDLSGEATTYAKERYPEVEFITGDVTTADYSQADLVVSFETIEHLPDPTAFLKALAACPGRIVISTPNRKTHSPGNNLEDKPLNTFHTIEWTPNEFADLVCQAFPGRQVRFLSQQARWPGLIHEGLDDEAMYCIAVIGDGDLPSWPRLGLAMPTVDNSTQALDTITYLSRYYPGEVVFAVVANGTSEEHLTPLRQLRDSAPYMVHLLEEPTNLGYGMGANRGLDHLWQTEWFDYFGVINDDIVPSVGCTIELVRAFQQLDELGHKPGLVAPVSNNVNGRQHVDIGSFGNLAGMMYRAERHQWIHKNSASRHFQLRGLYLLIHPDCLSDLGGFDPRFGLGNFEDDDYNLRAKLAGFSLWIADGAFVFHHGSQTFGQLDLNYQGIIERNMQVFQWKWDLENPEDWPYVNEAPEGLALYVPLTSSFEAEFSVTVNGKEHLDLIHQASDVEFAAWVYERMRHRPRDFRREVVGLFTQAAVNAGDRSVAA